MQPQNLNRTFLFNVTSTLKRVTYLMTDFIQHLFDYQFLNRALITSIVVGIVCGTVGSLIILRGLSLMGDAMSHAVLPGVALSFLFNIPMFVGALVTGMIASLLIGYISNNGKTKPDATIGISFTAFLATGVIIISLINSDRFTSYFIWKFTSDYDKHFGQPSLLASL